MAKIKAAERRRFIDWYTTSRFYRIPSTQEELAKELNVLPQTLSKWKRMFREEIVKESRDKLRDELPQILAALVDRGKAGEYQQAKLILDLLGEMPAQRIEQTITSNVKGYVKVSPDDWDD